MVQLPDIRGFWFQEPYPSWFLGPDALNVGYSGLRGWILNPTALHISHYRTQPTYGPYIRPLYTNIVAVLGAWTLWADSHLILIGISSEPALYQPRSPLKEPHNYLFKENSSSHRYEPGCSELAGCLCGRDSEDDRISARRPGADLCLAFYCSPNVPKCTLPPKKQTYFLHTHIQSTYRVPSMSIWAERYTHRAYFGLRGVSG